MRKLVVLVLLVPALALAIYDVKFDTLGNWRCSFSNYGPWGFDPTGQPGGFWRDTAYVFGAGFWFGAIAEPDTLVTVGYDPNTGASELVPMLTANWRQGWRNPADRIYSYPGDWPPPSARFPMAPDTALAPHELWAGCCDSDARYHTPPGRPIGIDLCLTVFAFDDSLSLDVFYLLYEMYNPQSETLHGLYAGMVTDADVGNPADDRTGLILNRWFQVRGDTFTVRSTGFCWSQDNVPSGAVATRLLKGPHSDSLAAFKLFHMPNDPRTDGDKYMALAGYDWPMGQYDPFDSIDPGPDDKRYLLSAGPFDIAPQAAETLLFAVFGTPFDTTDTNELALRAEWARKRWNLLPGVEEQPPTARNVQPIATIVRGVLLFEARGERREARAELLDISGRRVLDLLPGANDVSRVPPGVYFVRIEPSAVSREPSAVAVHKVVVQR
jgi:hypothetical protein